VTNAVSDPIQIPSRTFRRWKKGNSCPNDRAVGATVFFSVGEIATVMALFSVRDLSSGGYRTTAS
jgi:hypothetical protein